MNERMDLTADPTRGTRGAERAMVYQFLSRVFSSEIRAEDLGELARAGDAAALSKTSALQPVFTRLRAMSAAPEAAETELSRAYTFLFLGAGGPQSVPPYESVFASLGGKTNQAATAAMVEELRKLDLHVEAAFPEPADHISVELSVAGVLADRCCPRADQVRFLKERLMAWLPAFAKACTQQDQTEFYACAAQAAANFVESDLSQMIAGSPRLTTKEETTND